MKDGWMSLGFSLGSVGGLQPRALEFWVLAQGSVNIQALGFGVEGAPFRPLE